MNNTTPNKTNPNHHFNSTSNQNSSWSWMPNQEESPTSINEEVVSRGAELNKSFDSATAGNSSSKRGRPKSELLTTLMIQGSTSPSAIKCKFCNRVFPRDKSLSAHLRTHTGIILHNIMIINIFICARGYKNLIITIKYFFYLKGRGRSIVLFRYVHEHSHKVVN